MKKILKIGFLLSISLVIASCEDYLERTPDAVISEETAFVNFQNFQGFTEELYNCIPNIPHSGYSSSFNWGDDEIVSNQNTNHIVTRFDRGDFFYWQANISGGNWMDRNEGVNTKNDNDGFTKGLWPLAWYGIRKANLGLANLNRLTSATDEEKKLIEGQLLFFRAYFHFSLMQYFGGLPYIDRILPGNEPLREARLNYQQTAEKAAADFRRAADILPIDWDKTLAGSRTIGKNQFRINKIMALGYLGKNLLYAGSPLMNYESTGSKTYNQEFCKRAADAFGELLKLVEAGETQYGLEPWGDKYKEIFMTRGQNWKLPGGKEAIFRSTYWAANTSNYFALKEFLPKVIGDPDDVKVPTANYVKFYSMNNGLPVPENVAQADLQSGYDPEYPWKNRDPRFYQNFFYDGVKMVIGAITDENLRYAGLFTGGPYRSETQGSRTGFVLGKFIIPGYNKFDQLWSYGNSPHFNLPYMRLADVYLMYAEAALMGSNSISATSSNFVKTAQEAVNAIRLRAGMVPVHSNFLGDVDLFLGEIRRERAVELSFEGHRFNDLRRWLLLIEKPYIAKTALEFNRAGTFNTTDPSLNRVLNIRERVLLERPFTEKHYWLPFKTRDVSLYPEFSQNPGW